MNDIGVFMQFPSLTELWAHTVQGSSFKVQRTAPVEELRRQWLLVSEWIPFENANAYCWDIVGYTRDLHSQLAGHIGCVVLSASGVICYETAPSTSFEQLLKEHPTAVERLIEVFSHRPEEIFHRLKPI